MKPKKHIAHFLTQQKHQVGAILLSMLVTTVFGATMAGCEDDSNSEVSLEEGEPKNVHFERTELIPAMTGNTAPSGVVTSYVDSKSSPAWHALDADHTNSHWLGIEGGWFAYEFPKAVRVDAYFIKPGVETRRPSTWYLMAYNETGRKWDLLDMRYDESWNFGTATTGRAFNVMKNKDWPDGISLPYFNNVTLEVNSQRTYKKYRLIVAANDSNKSYETNVSIKHFQLYNDKEIDPGYYIDCRELTYDGEKQFFYSNRGDDLWSPNWEYVLGFKEDGEFVIFDATNSWEREWSAPNNRNGYPRNSKVSFSAFHLASENFDYTFSNGKYLCLANDGLLEVYDKNWNTLWENDESLRHQHKTWMTGRTGDGVVNLSRTGKVTATFRFENKFSFAYWAEGKVKFFDKNKTVFREETTGMMKVRGGTKDTSGASDKIEFQLSNDEYNRMHEIGIYFHKK